MLTFAVLFLVDAFAPSGRGEVDKKSLLPPLPSLKLLKSLSSPSSNSLFTLLFAFSGQAGGPASASTGLYRQKGKINPGNTGSQPKPLHIRGDIETTNKHILVLDPMVFLKIF
jgi:hypothetical protein